MGLDKKEELQEEIKKAKLTVAPGTKIMMSATRLLVDQMWNLVRNPRKFYN